MIIVKVCKNETRERDKKRRRLLLSIGDLSFHITQAEAKSLRNNLNKFVSEIISKRRK